MNFCPKCGYIFPFKKRSIQQNRAYFGLAVARIAEQCNTTKEDMHKALAYEFLGVNPVSINGKIIMVPKSTSRLTTKEFSEFFEKIQRWGAENGIDITSPNEK